MSSISRTKGNQNIQVYVRCRPINERERLIRSMEMIEVSSAREILVKSSLDNKMTKKFTFDRTFGPESEQKDVYKVVVAPLIEEVLAGYNCTVFAYGQTGTGKTHTMVGDATPKVGSTWDDATEVGIIPRALSHLFEDLRMAEVEFSMRVSYLELYNEELSDLLASGEMAQIRIFDDAQKKGSIIVQGLEEIPVHSTADVYKLLAKGQERRKMAPTLMNAQSSRSHTIFSILVHIKENGMDGEELLKIGKLNLVDLAGSENISKTGNEKGIRARESVNINQSLLTLGRVITALVERTPHVPYRESKLTRLLQESLGGRTKTSIIATISPGHKDLEETVSTLEYAHRAKNIQNKPEVNQKLTKKTVLKEYTEEIDKLKRDLVAAREKNGVYLAQDTYNEMQYQIESNNREISERTAHIRALKEDMLDKQKLFAEVSLCLTQRTQQLEQVESVLDNTKKTLQTTQKRYQEKKEIANCHQKTERVLTDQAKELMNVANTATSDANSLQETIERRRIVDKQIQQASGQFESSMNDHLNGMTSKLETFTNDFAVQAKRLFSQLITNKEESAEMCSTAQSNLKLLIECQQNGKREIVESIHKHVKDFDDLQNKHKTAKKMRMDTNVQWKKTADEDVNNRQTRLDTNLTSESNVYQSLEKLVVQHIENLKRFNINLEAALKQNAVAIKTLKESQEIIEKETTENKEMNNQLLEFVKHFVAKSDAKNVTLQNIQPELNSVEKLIGKCETEVQTALTDFNGCSNDAHASIQTTIKQGQETHTAITTQISEVFEMHRNTTNQFVEKTTNMEAEYENQDAATNQELNSMIDDIDNIAEATEINLSAGLENIIKDVKSENERVESHYEKAIDIKQEMEKIHQSSVDDFDNQIVASRNRLQKFQKDELKVYAASGNTPLKRDFHYPRNLVATSPHPVIIQRFWNSHGGGPLDCSNIAQDDTEMEYLSENGIDASTNLSSSISTMIEVTDRTLRESHSNFANSTLNSENNSFKLSNSSKTVSSTFTDKENTIN